MTRLTRHTERGSDDRNDLDALLDQTLVGTLSTVVEGGPWSVPVFFARDGDRVLVHGSTGAGLLRHVCDGAPATLTVFQLDGIVVADSGFNSGANYRSAVLRGTLGQVTGEQQDQALWILTDKVIPGRSREVRPSSTRELAATLVLAMPILPGHWVYKSRSGPAGEPQEPSAGTWVGVVPFTTVAGEPVAAEWLDPSIPVPDSVIAMRDRHRPGPPS